MNWHLDSSENTSLAVSGAEGGGATTGTACAWKRDWAARVTQATAFIAATGAKRAPSPSSAGSMAEILKVLAGKTYRKGGRKAKTGVATVGSAGRASEWDASAPGSAKSRVAMGEDRRGSACDDQDLGRFWSWAWWSSEGRASGRLSELDPFRLALQAGFVLRVRRLLGERRAS